MKLNLNGSIKQIITVENISCLKSVQNPVLRTRDGYDGRRFRRRYCVVQKLPSSDESNMRYMRRKDAHKQFPRTSVTSSSYLQQKYPIIFPGIQLHTHIQGFFILIVHTPFKCSKYNRKRIGELCIQSWVTIKILVVSSVLFCLSDLSVIQSCCAC